MTKNDIISTLFDKLQIGMSFENPGGGTSIVKSITAHAITYQRRNSRISLPIDSIEEVVNKFSGKTIHTVDLRVMDPNVFDSKKNGHSCNCTFLFMLFERMGWCEGTIQGRGVHGNTFFVHLKDLEAIV